MNTPLPQDVKITKVTIPDGATVHKTVDSYGSPCFGVAAVLTLEDGRELPYVVTTKRKKDLMDAVERRNNHAANSEFFACFRDDGSFWGTSTKYRIG